jgi:CheY-like chemotaxis protein
MKVEHAGANREKVFPAVRPKWMVVDDNETILRLMAERLALLTDAEICCFQSAKEAVRAFEIEPSAFALVVTDFDMPEMNGAELCRRLRVIAPESKIILTTGSADISAIKALNLGFNAFLAKPFPMSALLVALELAKRGKNSPSSRMKISLK